MEPATILYIQGTLGDSMGLLAEACRKFGYFLWSLRGDPSVLQVMPNTAAFRVSIFPNLLGSDRPPELESSIGTVHLVRVQDGRTRVSMQREDLAGNPLPKQTKEEFSMFCATFEDFLQIEKCLLTDLETGGKTTVFKKMADTGTLPGVKQA
ncbi:MAG: hypothetical protein GTO14_13170 [Anaerolineales bacterium]|nr:hypothetical protein [Anaerolineales bacterium]